MCKYCKQENRAIFESNVEDLLQIPIIHGIGDFVTRADDECRDEIDICIEGEDLVVYARLGGVCERVADLPIKCCPVCGQKLSDLISQK